MARPGPAPQPTHLKLVRGVRRDRINADEPKPARKPPAQPAWLSPEAKKVWRKTAPLLDGMGVLFETDGDMLGAYCEAVARYVQATRLLRAEGLLIPGRHDGMVKNPAAQIAREAETTMVRLAQEFGMTPASRSRIKLEATGGDELDDLLG